MLEANKVLHKAVPKDVPQSSISHPKLFDILKDGIFVLDYEFYIYSYASDKYISYSSEAIDIIRNILESAKYYRVQPKILKELWWQSMEFFIKQL